MLLTMRIALPVIRPTVLAPILLATAVLAATGLVAPAAMAQLDLRPPGVGAPARPAAPAVRRPAETTARVPRTAPLPLPRPEEAGAGEAAGEPQLATAPPAPAAEPPPAAEAPAAQPPAPQPPGAQPPAAEAPATPDAPPAGSATAAVPNRFDEAFGAAGTAPSGPPPLAPVRAAPPYASAPERRIDGRPFAERSFPTGREAHLPAVRRLAGDARVPIDLADAIIAIETAYDPQAVGMADEIGLMQIRLSVARTLGFAGTEQELFEPETNIRLGVAQLAGAWERSGGNLCEALARYRNGWDNPRMSPLVTEYCRRAVAHLAAIDSPLARGSGMPAASPAPAASADRPAGRFDWSDHETRIRQIEQRFGGQNFGIIAR